MKNILCKNDLKSFIIFALILAYCFLASFINSIPFISVIIPAIFTFFLFKSNLKILYNKKLKLLYLIFFIINSLILLFDIKYNFLPLTHMDFHSFDIFAQNAMNSNNIIGMFKNSIDLFVFFVAVLYKFFGIHAEMIAFYVFPFTFLVFKYMYKTVFEIANNKTISLISAIIVNFWPVNYLFGFSVLREIPNQFVIVLSFYFIVKFIKSDEIKDKVRFAILSIVNALIASSIHSGFIGIVIVYMYIILQKFLFKKIKILNLPIILTVLLLLIIITFTPLWPMIAGRFTFLNSFDDLLSYIQNRYNYLENANTAYITSVPKNIFELILSIPYRLVMFIFAPFVWQIYDFSTLFAFVFDSVPRLLMMIGIIFVLLKKNKKSFDNEIIKTAVLIFIFTCFIFCIDVNNYGTAMRHRSKLLPIEILLLVGYGYVYYGDYVKNKMKNFMGTSKAVYRIKILLMNLFKEEIMYRKKKVLHLLASNKFSGAENVACIIIDSFKDKYDMAYCSLDGDIKNTLKNKEIKYYGLNKFNLNEFRKVVEEYKPDIIHAHDVKATVLSSFFSKKCDLISHIHGNSFEMRKTTLKSLLFLWASRKVGHIFWVSQSSYNQFKFRNEVARKSSILQNIISLKDVIYKSNLSNSPNSDIIFVGRLIDIKDPMRLMIISHEVIKIIPSCKIAILGDGVFKEQMEKYIVGNSLTDNITLYGFQDNVYTYMKNSKIMIMTSKYEGTPMCALEGMALGLPIIATPTDGLVEIIDNNKNGYLSAENEELVKHIVCLLNNDKLLKRYSANAIKTSKKINDIEKYKKILDSKYTKE